MTDELEREIQERVRALAFDNRGLSNEVERLRTRAEQAEAAAIVFSDALDKAEAERNRLWSVANVTEHYDDHGHEVRVFAEGRKRHPAVMDCNLCSALAATTPGEPRIVDVDGNPQEFCNCGRAACPRTTPEEPTTKGPTERISDHIAPDGVPHAQHVTEGPTEGDTCNVHGKPRCVKTEGNSSDGRHCMSHPVYPDSCDFSPHTADQPKGER